MSQINAYNIERRFAELAQEAWPDLANRFDLGIPITTEAAPKGTVRVPEVAPDSGGGIRQNRYLYLVTVYGRFPIGSDHPSKSKDERVNDLYDAVIGNGTATPKVGKLYDTDDTTVLADNLRMASVDRKDYMPDGDRLKQYDVAVTFTCTARQAY